MKGERVSRKALLRTADYLIKSYVNIRDALKELGIIRTNRLLHSDYAEWLCANLLGLRVNENPNEKGFDALDNDGNRYQIKSRIVKRLGDNVSFDFRSWDFDNMLCVFFSESLDLLAIAKVSREVVKRYAQKTRANYRFRWTRETYENPEIEWVYMDKF